MHVLTAYASQPPSAGWVSTSPNIHSPPRTFRFGQVVPKGSPLLRIHTGRQKRCKSQLEKMNKSMVASSQPSKKTKLKKRSVAIENSTNEVTPCAPVIKGILIKPSTLINLYQTNSPNTGSEIALVAGSTSARRPSVSTSCKPAVKKVRFSISEQSRPQNSVLQRRFPTFDSSFAAGLAPDETDLIHNDIHLEPVTETIFFTHSRYSYDRSPITVDKVLNKSLDLPPRAPIDSFSAGRWLPRSCPSNRSEVLDDRCQLALGNQEKKCLHVDGTDCLNDETLSEMPPNIVSSPHFIIYSNSPAAGQMEGLQCHVPVLTPNNCNSEDCSITSSSPLPRPKSCPSGNWSNGLCTRNKPPPSENQDETFKTLTSLRNSEAEAVHVDDRIMGKIENQASTFEDNLSCHSFGNLQIEENLDGTEDCILEVDDILGIGNWTRAQVFGSCDALDGF